MKPIPRYKKSSFAILRELYKDYATFQRKLVRDYGDICHAKIWNLDLILISKPEYIKHILSDNQKNYAKYNRQNIFQQVFGKYGIIFTNDFKSWKKDKAIAVPAFKENHLENYGKIITENCQKMLQEWDSYAQKNELVNLDVMITNLVLKNLLQNLFGNLKFDINRFSYLLRTVVADLEFQIKSFLNLRWKLPTPTRAKFQKALKQLHALIIDIINQKKNLPRQENDLLDMFLIGYQNEPNQAEAMVHLRDELLTFISAGHETTIATINWVLILLSQFPTAARRLREEVMSVVGDRLPTYQDLEKMPYLEGVIFEALRLFSPVFTLPRQAVAADEIDGYPIPAKALIDIPIIEVHRRADYWENPEGFDPERYANIDLDDKYLYAFIPFGAGPRVCLGKNFALLQVGLIVTTIIQKYFLYLPAHFELHMPTSVILRPQLDLKMKLKKID